MDLLKIDEAEKFIANNKLAVILATTKWCYPCKEVADQLDSIKNAQKKINIAGIDMDDNYEFAKLFNIISVPTILYFKHGKIVDKLYGKRSNLKLATFLNL